MRNTLTLLTACCACCLIPSIARAQQYGLTWYTFDGGGSRNMTGGQFTVSGTSGQPDASAAMTGGPFVVTGGFWHGAGATIGGPCSTIADCADLDGDAIRDDLCMFWECVAGACIGTNITYADMGGQLGACPVDGFADANDRFHALNCFSDLTTDGSPGYPCEANSPFAYNVDSAGLQAPCIPDGVCDGHDAFAVLNAFGGLTTCSCDSSGPPAPTGVEFDSALLDTVVLELVPSRKRVARGATLEVEVYITGGVSDLRGYQLHALSSAGLELIDMAIARRADHAFAGRAYWEAYNIRTNQMLAGMDGGGITSRAGRLYLATLVYRVTAVGGTHAVDLRHEHGDSAQRTFMFTSLPKRAILISRTTPAVIEVTPRRDDEGRHVRQG